MQISLAFNVTNTYNINGRLLAQYNSIKKYFKMQSGPTAGLKKNLLQFLTSTKVSTDDEFLCDCADQKYSI